MTPHACETTTATDFAFTPPEGFEVELRGSCHVHPWHRIDSLDTYQGPGCACYSSGFREDGYLCCYDRRRPDTLVGRVCPPDRRGDEVDPLVDDLLAQKLNFPWMILNRDHTVRVPLEETVRKAQQAIDEGLAALADEQRRRYRAASSSLVLPLFPSGEIRCITLKNGQLRLRDDVTAAEAIAHYGDAWYGVRPSLESVRTAAEVAAYRDCGKHDNGSLDEDTPRIWEQLVPYIRDGRIRCADLWVTEPGWSSLAYLDRVGVCLAFRRLITQEGWPVAYAAEVVDFMAALHCVAGDTAYDVGEELVAAGPALEEFLARDSRTWDMVTGEAEWPTQGSATEEEYHARYRRPAHGIIEALRERDVPRALRWLKVYRGESDALFDSIQWDWTIFDELDAPGEAAETETDETETDDEEGHLPDPVGWMATVGSAAAYAVVRALFECLRDCPNKDEAHRHFREEHARLVREDRIAILQGLVYKLAGFPVGDYAAGMCNGSRPALDQRLCGLTARAHCLVDALEAAPQGAMAGSFERAFLYACVEAMVGVPAVERIEGTVGRDVRYEVFVPSGGYEIGERRLGVARMLERHSDAQAMVEAFDDADWEVLWEALKDLWENALLDAYILDSWQWAPRVTPGVQSADERTAAFMALLHSGIKGCTGGWTRGRMPVKGRSLRAERLYKIIDDGLQELGMPSTGVAQRLRGVSL